MQAAHTTVVVTVPGLGDDIQAIKAGLLEVADVLVVNKADREGADRTERDLMHMLDLRTGERKDVEIVRTIATRGTAEGSGITESRRDRAHRNARGRGMARSSAPAPRDGPARRARPRTARRPCGAHGGGARRLAEIAQAVVERRQDPWTLAEELVATL